MGSSGVIGAAVKGLDGDDCYRPGRERKSLTRQRAQLLGIDGSGKVSREI